MAERKKERVALSAEESTLCYTLVKEFGGTKVVLFGSTLWKQYPGDIDLLVTGIDPKMRFRLERQLEAKLKRPVDVVAEEFIGPHLAAIVASQLLVAGVLVEKMEYSAQQWQDEWTAKAEESRLHLEGPNAESVWTAYYAILVHAQGKFGWELPIEGSTGHLTALIELFSTLLPTEIVDMLKLLKEARNWQHYKRIELSAWRGYPHIDMFDVVLDRVNAYAMHWLRLQKWPPVAPKGIPQPMTELRHEVAELRQDNIELRQDNIELRQDNIELRQEVAALRARLASAEITTTITTEPAENDPTPEEQTLFALSPELQKPTDTKSFESSPWHEEIDAEIVLDNDDDLILARPVLLSSTPHFVEFSPSLDHASQQASPASSPCDISQQSALASSVSSIPSTPGEKPQQEESLTSSAPYETPPSTGDEGQQESLPSSTSATASTPGNTSTSTAQPPEVSNTSNAKRARRIGSRKTKRKPDQKVEEKKVDLDLNARLKSHLPSALMVLSRMPGVPARLLAAVDSELATVLLDTIPSEKWNSFIQDLEVIEGLRQEKVTAGRNRLFAMLHSLGLSVKIFNSIVSSASTIVYCKLFLYKARTEYYSLTNWEHL